MFCQKCGTENEETSSFCNNCGNSMNIGIETSSNSSSGTASSKKASLPKGVKITLIVVAAIFVMSVAFVVYAVLSDRPSDQSTDYVTGSNTNISESVNTEVSLEDQIAGIQGSTAATVELCYDSSKKKDLSAELLDNLKQNMRAENLETFDDPNYFIPEYKITLDTGVSYKLMQEPDNNFIVLQFEEDATIYKGVYDIFHPCTALRTQLIDDFAQMHLFTDVTKDTGYINEEMLKHFANNAVAKSCDSIFGNESIGGIDIDSYKVVDMSDTIPNLQSVLIEYSVLPIKDITLPNEPSVYKENGKIRGNYLVGALWIDKRETGARLYYLGFDHFVFDGNEASQNEAAQKIFERSYAKKLAN